MTDSANTLPDQADDNEYLTTGRVRDDDALDHDVAEASEDDGRGDPARHGVSQVREVEVGTLSHQESLGRRPGNAPIQTTSSRVMSTPASYDERVVGVPGDVLHFPSASTPLRAETIGSLSLPAGRSPAFVAEHPIRLETRRGGGSLTVYRSARSAGDELMDLRAEVAELRKSLATMKKDIVEREGYVDKLVAGAEKMKKAFDTMRRTNGDLTRECNALRSENAAFRNEAGVTAAGSPERRERDHFNRAAQSTAPRMVQGALGIGEPVAPPRARDDGYAR